MSAYVNIFHYYVHIHHFIMCKKMLLYPIGFNCMPCSCKPTKD